LNWLDFGGTQRLMSGRGGMNAKCIHVTLEQYLHNGFGMELFELPKTDLNINADQDAFVEQLLTEVTSRLNGQSKWDGQTKGPQAPEIEPIADRDSEGIILPADIVTALA